MTQVQLILRHLEDFGSITPVIAMREYGCMRLAARVSDLKDMGYRIISERETSKNRYGETISYSRYRLEDEWRGHNLPSTKASTELARE